MVPCLWWLAKKRGKEGRRRRRRRQSINHLSYSTIPCPTAAAAPFFQGEGPALRAMYANLGGLPPLTGEKGTDGAKVGKETPPKKVFRYSSSLFCLFSNGDAHAADARKNDTFLSFNTHVGPTQSRIMIFFAHPSIPWRVFWVHTLPMVRLSLPRPRRPMPKTKGREP